MASDASVSLGLDFVQFRQGLAQAQKSFESTVKTFKVLAIGAAGAIGAKFSFDAFKHGIEGAVEAGKQLDILSKQTGIAAGDITLMTHAFDRSGQSAETTTDILKEFRDKMILSERQIGGTNQTLKYLGTSFEELNKKALPEQFETVANAINKIQDPLQKAALSAKFFGESGGKAVAAFKSGDVSNATKLFGKSAQEQAAAAEKLAQVSVSFKRIQSSFTLMFGSIASKLAPIFEKIAAEMEQLLPSMESTFSKIVDFANDFIGVMVNAFKTGQLGDLLYLALQIAFMKSVDFALGLAKGSIQAIQEMLGQALSVLFSKNTLMGLGDGIIGVFVYAGNKALEIFLNVFEKPLKALQDGLTYIFENAGAVFQSSIGKTVGKLIDGAMLLNPLLAAPAKLLKDSLGDIKQARTFEQIQKQNTFSFGGIGREDAAKNAKIGSDMLANAGDRIKQGIIDGGASLDAILREFMDGFKSAGIFGPELDEKMKEIGSLISSLLPNKQEVTDQKKDQKKSVLGVAQTTFDEFRRVGGGLGGAASSVPQKQLDRLTEIRDQLKKGSNGASFSRQQLKTGLDAFSPTGPS